MAAAAKLVNPNAEIVAKSQSLLVNVSAGRGLASVLKSNLGPRGTLKMLVGGAGQIKLTKDGAVLLKEMQIMRPTAPQFFDQERVGAHTLAGRSLRRHPTATMIARTATAQDEITGDGTTSVVLLTGELLKCAERYVGEGMHPRVIAEGYDLARDKALEILDACAVGVDAKNPPRELLQSVARTALRTKLQPKIADLMTGAVVDAVLTVRDEDDEGSLAVDLHMVEVMTMEHKLGADSRFVRGLVLDHASRHPDMPKRLTNCRRRGAEIGPDRDGVASMASPWSRVFVRNVFAIASGPRRSRDGAAPRRPRPHVQRLARVRKVRGRLGLLLLERGAAREAHRERAQVHGRQGEAGPRRGVLSVAAVASPAGLQPGAPTRHRRSNDAASQSKITLPSFALTTLCLRTGSRRDVKGGGGRRRADWRQAHAANAARELRSGGAAATATRKSARQCSHGYDAARPRTRSAAPARSAALGVSGK